MSQQAIARFLELITSNEALEAELNAAAEQGDVAEAAAALGKKQGLEFSGEEFSTAISAFYGEHAGEIDEADLEGVVGGFNPQPEPPGAVHKGGSWLKQGWTSKFRSY